MSFKKIVLHIPHAAIGGLNDAVYSDRRSLYAWVRDYTDWFTDYLFDQHMPGVVAVQSIFSRSDTGLLKGDHALTMPVALGEVVKGNG